MRIRIYLHSCKSSNRIFLIIQS
ncbi:hypothetical protein MXB_4604 [Myxobolus squamalis]|nr:hypothetical protein MXB_4604 [Myxobolus squamalis]